MAPMVMGQMGWESSLSAFRIDGSEQIDVVCMVAVCPDDDCPQLTCPSNKDRTARSLEKKHPVRLTCPSNKDRTARSLEKKHPVRVDRRLIVKARTSDSFEKDDRAFSELCLQPSTYLSALLLLALSLMGLAVCVCVGVKRRTNSVEDLLSISQ
ncbi:hypothetical protein COOONC_02837 [Cooperia oncophora]